MSMSAVLTCLDISTEREKVTEELSAALSQLTRLQRLKLHGDGTDESPVQPPAVINLDLPLLERLKISCCGLIAVRLSCPLLRELSLECATIQSFSGMPSHLQKVSLFLYEDSLPLQELIPAHVASHLEELELDEDFRAEDLKAVQDLCLDGKLRCLNIGAYTRAGGPLCMDASWQAVPRTLQHVTLHVPLDAGIPRILEQFVSLVTLTLWHCLRSYMHLDRPLDPFLDMPRLKRLKLWSGTRYSAEAKGTGMCMWTPGALRLLGLAEKRITQMQSTLPRRSILLSY